MHNLCVFWFFVQKSFSTKCYFLIAEINLTTWGPLHTCLVHKEIVSISEIRFASLHHRFNMQAQKWWNFFISYTTVRNSLPSIDIVGRQVEFSIAGRMQNFPGEKFVLFLPISNYYFFPSKGFCSCMWTAVSQIRHSIFSPFSYYLCLNEDNLKKVNRFPINLVDLMVKYFIENLQGALNVYLSSYLQGN